MASLPEWLKLWLVACSSQTPNTAVSDTPLGGAIGFRCDESEYKVDLRTGAMLAPGDTVTCWIEGSSDTMTEIAFGALNIQKAMVTGQIKVSGSPMQLLSMSKVVDAGLCIKNTPPDAKP